MDFKKFVSDILEENILKIITTDDEAEEFDEKLKKNEILIVFDNGKSYNSYIIMNIYDFIVNNCFMWAFKNGYFLTINYAPAIVMIYPKTVETHEHKPFLKGANLEEAMINTYQWILKNKG
jgi:hypothetical protein